MSRAVLSLDIGTTSIKAGWFGRDGAPISDCVGCPTAVVSDRHGRASIDPAGFIADICRVVDLAYRAMPAGTVPAGVTVSAFWHSLLGLDRAGHPTTEILTWADRRAAGHVAPADTADYARTGAPPHSAFWPAKLRWLAATEGAAFRASRHWVSAPDYLALLLFGALRTGLSMASGTGLCDGTTGQWYPPALQTAGIAAESLPDIDQAPYAGLLPDYARRWPLLADIPWFKAIGDGACANLGVGFATERDLVLMLGTSGSMRVVSSTVAWPPADRSQWRFRVDESRFAWGMALSEGGAIAEWARQTLHLEGEGLEARVGAAAPDGHGLTISPYILGMRSPFWREGQSAGIIGLTYATAPAEIYQAMLESVALRFATLLDQLETGRARFARIAVTGGGFTGSPVWTQIVADAIGRPLHVLDVPQASLRGAALAGLARLGFATPETGTSARIVQPRPERHATYKTAALRQNRLIALLDAFNQG